MRHTLIAAACVAALPAWAQDATVSAPSQASQQVIVTGNPLRQADPAAPASVLSDEALAVRRSSTLGETLDGLPGVAATGFGLNASRPVIRGQDGDRIRILSNAGASLDASSLSFDHAVPLDPLVIERIEVLRGPAALLYGGSALGGVVNAIDNRIPKSPLEPLSGALELRGGGAARERALSGLVEGGADGLAWHADGFARRTTGQRQRLETWLHTTARPVVIEIGAGSHVPTVRWFSETLGVPLIRINPTEPDIPGRGVSLACGGLEALSGIHAALLAQGSSFP